MSDNKVIVFRKRLLSYSETFIADQGQFLPAFKPLFCGYHLDDSGIHLIKGSKRFLLDEISRFRSVQKLLFKSGVSGGGGWKAAIAELNPAIIHAHFFNDGIDALSLGNQLSIPVVTTLHGHDITKYENAKAASAGSKNFFGRVDRVIAVSNFIADQALARGCPQSKLVQHYIGIDLNRFNQPKSESENPSLLFVGRLVEKKGCTYLLQAMEKLKSDFPELTLTIVGDGNLKESLQQEVAERGLSVKFLGTQSAEQIRQLLASSWLFVAPSITARSGDAEGLGMVFLEAQALRTPVVSFRSGGVVEAVEHGDGGLLCEEKDVDSLRDNIKQLLESDSNRHKMGENGRRRVEERFDVRRQCADLEKIYLDIM